MKINVIAAAVALAVALPAVAVTKSEAEAASSDAELNRTYAIEQLSSGNLEEALLGIERTIIAKPTDIPARFFRAKVLVLLGRGEEVKDELQFITTLKLAPTDLAEAEKLLAEIEKASRSFTGSVSVQMGLGYNDNANSYSKTGLRYGTTPLSTVYPQDKKIADTISQGAVIFSGKSTLNQSKTLALKYTAGRTMSNAADTHEKDMGVTLGSFGVEYGFGSGWFIGTKIGSTKVDRTNTVNGGDFATDISTTKYTFEIGKTLESGAKVTYLYSDSSDDHSGTTTAKRLDTSAKQHELRLSSPLSSSMLLSASVSSKETLADDRTYKDNYDKDTTAYSLNLYQFLAPGHLMTYGYSNSSSDYDSYTIPTDGGIRSDESSVLSVKYRIDGDKLFDALSGWKVTFGVKRSDTDSNLKSSQVESNAFDVTVSRVFDL